MEKPAITDTIRVTYLFDPLCGWCYGASATLGKLVFRPDITIELAPTGLFAGDGARPMDDSFATYAWANDQRISRLTGLPFSEDYRRKVLGDRAGLLDSGPATLALTAVALTNPEREFEALKAIQMARYVEGRDNTDIAVLTDVLRALNLHEAAGRLAPLFRGHDRGNVIGARDEALTAAYHKRVEAARGHMRRFRADGVPSLIVGEDGHQHLVRARALFGSMDALLADLKAA